MQGVIQIYILYLLIPKEPQRDNVVKIGTVQWRNKLWRTFVIKSMKNEINVFSSRFCTFSCPFAIAILRGGEGGEEKCHGGGVFIGPSPPSDKLEGNIEILWCKGRGINFMSGSLNSLARFHRVFVSVPFLDLSNLEDRNITTNNMKRINVVNRMLESLFSVRTISSMILVQFHVWDPCSQVLSSSGTGLGTVPCP